MRESVQKVIEEKRSESILRGNSSSISMKRASSRVSKLSFGGDEIRTYEKVRFLSTRRSNFWSRKVFEGVQYHVLIQFWPRVLLRIGTKIAYFQDRNRAFLSLKLHFWTKSFGPKLEDRTFGPILVVRIRNFGPDSKLNSGSK